MDYKFPIFYFIIAAKRGIDLGRLFLWLTYPIGRVRFLISSDMNHKPFGYINLTVSRGSELQIVDRTVFQVLSQSWPFLTWPKSQTSARVAHRRTVFRITGVWASSNRPCVSWAQNALKYQYRLYAVVEKDDYRCRRFWFTAVLWYPSYMIVPNSLLSMMTEMCVSS